MGFEKIKRNRFYEEPSPALPGGYDYPHLSRNHYEDQHELHLALERVHQSSLHDWGIAAGLAVTGSVAGNTVTIEAGAAVDINGSLMVLAVDGSGDIGTNPPASQHNEQATPVTMDLGGQSGSLCYVTLSHSEIIRPGEGSGGRAERVPWLRLQPVVGAGAYVDDGLSVILAVVDISGAGAIVSLDSDHGGAPLSRRLMDTTTRDLIFRRGSKSGNTVSETEAGRVAPDVGGGLKLTLPGSGDNLSIERSSGTNINSVDVRSNYMNIKDSSGRDVFNFRSATASLSLGANGNEGDLKLYDGAGRTVMHVDGDTSKIELGTTNNGADIHMRDNSNRHAIELNANSAAVYIGTTENEGDIFVRDGSNRNVLHFNGDSAWLRVGIEGNEGDIEVQDAAGRRVMHFDGEYAVLYLGAAGNEGDIRIRNDAGGDSISMDGASGNIWCNNWNIVGNPARKVNFVWLSADDGTSYSEIDLGQSRQVFAHVVMVGTDPRHDFDRGDAFAFDIWQIDGVKNSSNWSYNGDHWGAEGADSNFKSPTFYGQAQTIKFRARSMQDATVYGLGIVYWE
jgi:hypothetical protein